MSRVQEGNQFVTQLRYLASQQSASSSDCTTAADFSDTALPTRFVRAALRSVSCLLRLVTLPFAERVCQLHLCAARPLSANLFIYCLSAALDHGGEEAVQVLVGEGFEILAAEQISPGLGEEL